MKKVGPEIRATPAINVLTEPYHEIYVSGWQDKKDVYSLEDAQLRCLQSP